MKTKTTASRIALSAAAILAFGLNAGAQNTSYGANALFIGGATTAVFGNNSMLANTGSDNTSIGWGSMSSNTNGSANASGGYAALFSNISGGGNTAFGAKALDVNTGGSNNSGFGLKALTTNQNGSNNSALGYYANVAAPNLFNATAIGSNAIVNAPNKVRFGNAAVTVVEGPVAYTISDGRFKTNVKSDEVKGLSFIQKLRPVVYNFDSKKFTEFLTKNMNPEQTKEYMSTDFDPSTAIRQSGFIAQEVEQAAADAGYNFNGVHKPVNDNDNYSLAYGQFVVPLVKAVQEQQQMIEEQKVLIHELQMQNADQQKSIAALQARATGLTTQAANSVFTMEQNEPNPFNHETIVKYSLPESVSTAYMAVYDLSGKQVSTLPLTQKGSASVTLTSEKLAPGIYIYSIVADGKVFDSKRMIVAEK